MDPVPAPFKILIAEDNPADVQMFRETLKSRAVPFELAVAEDGQQALAMVKSAAGGQTHLDLIVLDINLPKYKGDEVLRQVRAEPSLSNVPVIMLTASSAPSDRVAAVRLGADLFIQKPSDLQELIEVAKLVEKVLKRGSPPSP